MPLPGVEPCIAPSYGQSYANKANWINLVRKNRSTLQATITKSHQTGSSENHRLKYAIFWGDMLVYLEGKNSYKFFEPPPRELASVSL